MNDDLSDLFLITDYDLDFVDSWYVYDNCIHFENGDVICQKLIASTPF